LAIQKELLGEDQPPLAYCLTSLGILLQGQGKLTEAEKMHRQALALWPRQWGSDLRKTQENLTNLVPVLKGQGKDEEAEKILDESLAAAPVGARPEALLRMQAELHAREKP